jgi:hypothetical protein
MVTNKIINQARASPNHSMMINKVIKIQYNNKVKVTKMNSFHYKIASSHKNKSEKT